MNQNENSNWCRNMNQRKNKTRNIKPAAGPLQNISPKMMAMILLVSTMAILWGRVLLKGNGPAKAKAADCKPMAAERQADSQAAEEATLQIIGVELPVLAGRNDRITHNMFSDENWMAFSLKEDANADNTVARSDTTVNAAEPMSEAGLRRITRDLTLESVMCDAQNRPTQAFVGNKILSVGSTLTVEEGPDQYVLTLEKISLNEVVFSWNEISVTLKLAETPEF